jgi:hypothetical protein
VLGAGCWVLGAGCWVLGAGCWVLGGAKNRAGEERVLFSGLHIPALGGRDNEVCVPAQEV